MSGPLFGIVPAGQPLITEVTSSLSSTSLLYALPTTKPFSHIVVFLLPNISLPDHMAAAIYLATMRDVAAAQQSNVMPSFKFLGAIGPGKESAMFKIGFAGSGGSNHCSDPLDGFMIGISVEPSETVGQQLQQLAASKLKPPTVANCSSQPTTALLAQRIIQNAFNFLSSFSGTTGPNGIEVIPLRAFEEWWRKFESRVRSDPSFLESQSE